VVAPGNAFEAAEPLNWQAEPPNWHSQPEAGNEAARTRVSSFPGFAWECFFLEALASSKHERPEPRRA